MEQPIILLGKGTNKFPAQYDETSKADKKLVLLKYPIFHTTCTALEIFDTEIFECHSLCKRKTEFHHSKKSDIMRFFVTFKDDIFATVIQIVSVAFKEGTIENLADAVQRE